MCSVEINCADINKEQRKVLHVEKENDAKLGASETKVHPRVRACFGRACVQPFPRSGDVNVEPGLPALLG